MLLAAGIAMSGCGDDDGKASKTPAKTAASSAGAVPDACGLLTDAEVAKRLGKGAARERETGTSLDGHAFSQCRWTAEPRELGVAVIASTARYETHRKLPGGERISGLGDKAIAREAMSLETHGGTGGRTVTIADGDRTLVVALDLGGTVGTKFDTKDGTATATRVEPVSTAEVVALARLALGRLR